MKKLICTVDSSTNKAIYLNPRHIASIRRQTLAPVNGDSYDEYRVRMVTGDEFGVSISEGRGILNLFGFEDA